MEIIATLLLALVGSVIVTDAAGPVGFQVLGTTVPKDAKSILIPEGWLEQQPDGINTTMPDVTADEQMRGYLTFDKSYLEMICPGTCPTRHEVTDSLEIFSVQDAFEIGTNDRQFDSRWACVGSPRRGVYGASKDL